MIRLCPLAIVLACSGDKTSDDTAGGAGATAVVDCSDITLTVPSPRGEQDGIWDAGKGRLVFFGGDEGMPENCISSPTFVGETWAFNADCDDFELLDAGSGPDARTRQAVALDATRNRMIIHGGRSREASSGNYDLFDDLWAFDLASDSWKELDAKDGPRARVNHTMVVAGDTLFLYGGNTSSSGTSYKPSAELWTLDLESLEWNLVEDDAAPDARLFHSMAVSDDGKKAWVYGGGDENAFTGPFFGDLWELDLASLDWTQVNKGKGGAPDARIWADLVYTGASDSLLLWGGHDDGTLGNTNQVWEYDLDKDEWSELREGDIQNASAGGFCDFPPDFVDIDPDSPERRYAGVGVWSGTDLVIFGGKTDCGQANDVWSYALAGGAWTQRSSATFGEACLRTTPEADCQSLCY